MSEIFTKSPYPGGYDLTVGTSDRGTNIQEVPQKSLTFNHTLLVFGGLQGLEAALSNDDKLQVDDPQLLFDHYLNVLPKQGSRTIRTEEAILIALTAIQEKLKPQHEDIEEELIKEALPRSEDTGGVVPKPGENKMAKKRKIMEEKQLKGEEEKQIKGKEQLPKQKQQEQQQVETKDEVVANEPVVKRGRNTRKTALKKSDDVNNSVVEGDDADFEVVPVGKKNIKKKTAKAGDLSRFD